MVGGCHVIFFTLPARFHVTAAAVGADAFHAAAREHALVRHVKQAVLKAGAAKVGNEDFHGIPAPQAHGWQSADYFKNASSTVSSGRGMICALTNSPLACAACAPASTAARTEPTSPRTNVVT